MRFAPAFIILALVGTQQAAQAADGPRLAAAAKAADCTLDPDAPFGASIARLPGQADAALQVVTTLAGPADADSIGTLCVALVHETGGRFVRIATLAGSDITPPSEIAQVSTVYAHVEATPFRFMPGEAAFAVSADGEYNSEVINLSWSTIYLFRRRGARLVPVFHAKLRDETIDKSADGATTGARWSMRFDTRQHLGAYDLILQRTHSRRQRRYVWNGSRYVPSSNARHA